VEQEFGEILLGGLAKPFYRLSPVLCHIFAFATTEFHLGLCVACFCLRLHFFNRFLIGLSLLRGQLNDRDRDSKLDRHLVFSVKQNPMVSLPFGKSPRPCEQNERKD
jgi:hypothetical protein